MDTISVKLSINFRKEVRIEDINYVKGFINNIQSPYGSKYCDFLENNPKGEIVIKISYPRFYYNNNAYLVQNHELCLEVNRHFCAAISWGNFQYEVVGIELIRVDIPFTYIMSNEHSFWHYENIYKIFAMVYTTKNRNSNPKMISTILDKRVETLNYADTKVVGNYNSKIMVYDQYKNLEDKLEDFQFSRTIERFGNLTNRMRLEVSKRINRKPFILGEFATYNIYVEYYPKFKKYLLDNFLDMDIIENIYTTKSLELANTLVYARNIAGFNYEVFILNNINNIFDYEILRRAFNISIENVKTREGAITAVRKILKEYQASNDVIVMSVYSVLKDIRDRLEKNIN